MELIGYLASALVVTSLAMSSVVRLRVISLTGSVIFVVYGALLPSVPIILTNVAVAALNIWYLTKEFSSTRDLAAVRVPVEDPFLVDFLASHAEDIAQFWPGARTGDGDNFALVLTRNGLPAGAVVGRLEGSTLRLDLDYVMKPYRDSRIGQWLYGRGSGALRDAGIRTVLAQAAPLDDPYLRRMGFVTDGAGLRRDL